MDPTEAVTGLAGLAVMIHGAITYARIRARRPRLCACGHGSGMHHMDRGCQGRIKERAADGAARYRTCGCALYDGQGTRVP